MKRERYFNDNGEEYHPCQLATPNLCFSCSKYNNGDPKEQILCNLNRADKQIDEIFLCFAYQPSSPTVDREQVLRDLCEKAGVDYSDQDKATEKDDEPYYF